MTIVTYLCSYGFISALLGFIPSAIARARGKNDVYWWASSSLGLMITIFFIGNNICLVPIAVLIILCIAAFVKLPTTSNEAVEN